MTRIEDYLLVGERRKAFQLALDEKLWSHAMLIARSLDADSWLEVVQLFIKSELDSNHLLTSADKDSTGYSSLEGLKMAYGLFGGLGASSRKL